jgi:hypothetical protein
MSETGTGIVEVDVVKKKFSAKEVMPEERWESLVEDCKDIVTEHVVRSREAIIEMKWHLGDRLLEEGVEVLTEEIVGRLGEELKISRTDLFRCVAFRRKFPNLDILWKTAPEGKNISWHKLVHNYIDFTTPKLEVPTEEMKDTFGLIKWWSTHADIHAIRLTDPEHGFSLMVKKDKAMPIEPKTNAREIYKELGEYYVKLKRWNPDDLNSNDYARMNRALKELLNKAGSNKDKVKQAIKWCHDNYGVKLEWSLETVVKKFADAVRPVKAYEKYMEKKG